MLLISLYWLILFQILREEDISRTVKALRESKKLPVTKLYENDQSDIKKLRDHIESFSMDERAKERVLIALDRLFSDDDCVRHLRNLKTHHYGEEVMKRVEDHLKVTYPSGKVVHYSLHELNIIRRNLKLLLLVSLYGVYSSFYSVLHQGIEHERKQNI
ncbi:MAG: hypothetical protein ACTSP4_08075 [Candidatus Hodarchaeales archaeon]